MLRGKSGGSKVALPPSPKAPAGVAGQDPAKAAAQGSGAAGVRTAAFLRQMPRAAKRYGLGRRAIQGEIHADIRLSIYIYVRWACEAAAAALLPAARAGGAFGRTAEIACDR